VLLVELPPEGSGVWVVTEQTALALAPLELLQTQDEFCFLFGTEFFHGLIARFAETPPFPL
jgi:hypothetical protein